MVKILYAEDDKMFADLCIQFLKSKGYEVVYAPNGERAWKLFQMCKPDVVLLDIKMPKLSGYEVGRLIRRDDAQIPMLYISSLTGTQNVIEGLSLGANDYIRKEYMLEEVEARILAALRSVIVTDSDTEKIQLSSNTLLDCLKNELLINGVAYEIRPIATRILCLLNQRPNEVVRKHSLMMDIWGNDSKSTARLLDKLLVPLRKLLEKDPDLEIKTVWGVGLSLVRRE